MKRIVTAPSVQPHDIAALATKHPQSRDGGVATQPTRRKIQDAPTISTDLQATLNNVAKSAFDIRRACNAMTNMSALITATALNPNEIDVPFLLESAQKITAHVLEKTGERDNPASVAIVMKTVVHALEELCRRDDTTTEIIESHLEMIGDSIIRIAKHPSIMDISMPSEVYLDLSSNDSVNCSLVASASSLATFAVDVGLEPTKFIGDSMSAIMEAAQRNTEQMKDAYAQSQSTQIFFQCVLRELTSLYITAWRIQMSAGLENGKFIFENIKANADARFAAFAGEILLAAAAGKSHLTQAQGGSIKPGKYPESQQAICKDTVAGTPPSPGASSGETQNQPTKPALKRVGIRKIQG